MGHQFSYYMTPKDTREVEQKLRSKVPLVIIARRSPSAEPRVVDSLLYDNGDVSSSNMALVRPEDLDRVVMDYVPAQGYWTAEVQDSPIIECGRCFFDGKDLLLDRLYYVDGFYGKDGVWIEKSDEFKSFAKTVFSATKRALMRHGWNYIGADAQAWADAGGTLVYMRTPNRDSTEPARISPK